MHFWPYRSRVLLVALGLVCCSPNTTIVTNKAADYTKPPQKLFVVESLGPGLGGDTTSFQNKLRDFIRGCGIEATVRFYTPRAPLDLGSDDRLAAIKEDVAKFRPDAILGISEVSRVVLQRNGATIGVTQVVYMLELLDATTQKAVWKAQVVLHLTPLTAGAFIDAGALLATDIANRVKQHAVLTSCPDAPSAPALRSVEAAPTRVAPSPPPATAKVRATAVPMPTSLPAVRRDTRPGSPVRLPDARYGDRSQQRAARVFAQMDGLRCRYTAASGLVAATVFGPYGEQAEKALQRLWPLKVGNEVSFKTLGAMRMSYDETYRVIRHETATVPAAPLMPSSSSGRELDQQSLCRPLSRGRHVLVRARDRLCRQNRAPSRQRHVRPPGR